MELGEQGWAIASAWGILGESRPAVVPPLPDIALQALFAPYCGGLAREGELQVALQVLIQMRFQGRRPVDGGIGHTYAVSWTAVRSPLEATQCRLEFVERPDLEYRFELVTHQLVSWLMDRTGLDDGSMDLPDAFWHWLLVGTDPVSEG